MYGLCIFRSIGIASRGELFYRQMSKLILSPLVVAIARISEANYIGRCVEPVVHSLFSSSLPWRPMNHVPPLWFKCMTITQKLNQWILNIQVTTTQHFITCEFEYLCDRWVCCNNVRALTSGWKSISISLRYSRSSTCSLPRLFTWLSCNLAPPSRLSGRAIKRSGIFFIIFNNVLQ